MLLVFQIAAGIVLAAVVLIIAWAVLEEWATRQARRDAIDRAWAEEDTPDRPWHGIPGQRPINGPPTPLAPDANPFLTPTDGPDARP